MSRKTGLVYEGYVYYADGTVVSLQCHENRCHECPREAPDGTPGGGGPGGHACEHECGHRPAEERAAPQPAALSDTAAIAIIAEWLRDPEWGVGMLEDIADAVRSTGRPVEDYPDGRATWPRH